MTTTIKRYEPDDDGLRFQDLTYVGNFKGMDRRFPTGSSATA